MSDGPSWTATVALGLSFGGMSEAVFISLHRSNAFTDQWRNQTGMRLRPRKEVPRRAKSSRKHCAKA